MIVEINNMEKRIICGNEGLEVSIVGLGCNAFGNRIDESSTHHVINAAIESGINFLDTAESYGDGKSESYMGTGLKGKRNDIFIAVAFAIEGSEFIIPKYSGLRNIITLIENNMPPPIYPNP